MNEPVLGEARMSEQSAAALDVALGAESAGYARVIGGPPRPDVDPLEERCKW